jgi:selenocysteine lyase/cysteine desulfurase
VEPVACRAQFPIAARRACFLSGVLSPASVNARAALERWVDLWSCDPMRLYLEYREEWERLRVAFAAVVGAESDEVAITDNTSRGSNLIVQMIEAPPGSNVVLDDYTYQSSLYPWRLAAKAHVEIRVVRARDHVIDPADFVPLVDERTVALSVTHVSWQTGFRHDLAALARLAHAHGAYLIVDAAQSAGALALDARALGVDFLVCGALKWLLGLPGVGFLYARREHVERLAVAQAGYAGVDRPATFGLGDDFAFKTGASRYELGLPSLPALAACREGIQLLLAVGLERVERHVLELSGYYLEGLARRGLRAYTPADPARRAGIVALPTDNGPAIAAFLRERGVDVWAHATLPILRADLHVFNNQADVDRLLDGLDAFAALRGRTALQA